MKKLWAILTGIGAVIVTILLALLSKTPGDQGRKEPAAREAAEEIKRKTDAEVLELQKQRDREIALLNAKSPEQILADHVTEDQKTDIAGIVDKQVDAAIAAADGFKRKKV